MGKMSRANAVTVGIIGCGWWGPKLVRCFSQLPHTAVKTVADLSADRLRLLSRHYPGLGVTRDYRDILNDPEIDGVCVATPMETHYELAREALRAGKHLLVEKPMALSRRDARELLVLARRKKRTLLADHTFLYSPPVRHIKGMVRKGELDGILYLDSVRINPGPPTARFNVLWDLAPHDVSISLHLLEEVPERVSATGRRYLHSSLEDVVCLHLFFPGGAFAQIHVSWLSAMKTRMMRIFGRAKSIIYDDAASEGKVRVCDKGMDTRLLPDGAAAPLNHSYGCVSVSTPALDAVEPLRAVAADFAECIATGRDPLVPGEAGYHVVCTLEAASRSLARGGAQVKLRT